MVEELVKNLAVFSFLNLGEGSGENPLLPADKNFSEGCHCSVIYA